MARAPHRLPSPSLNGAGAVTVVASRVGPGEGWVQSRLLVGGGVPVASANRRRLERGPAATFARQVRFGAWFRTLVRAYGPEGWRGGIWSAATCFRAGSAVQFSSFGERWLTALRGPSYFIAGGCLGFWKRYQHKGTTGLVYPGSLSRRPCVWVMDSLV